MRSSTPSSRSRLTAGRSIAPARWREGLAAIAASDGVVIAGGGNLSRTWPEHVFERAAGVRAARRAARPVAITGQTIGPAFDERTRELVAETLAGCVFVGAREEHSWRLAVELGVQPGRLVLQFDDAIGLDEVEPPRSSEIVGDGEFIAVTLNQLDDLSDPAGIVPKFAAQLAELGQSTGAAVVLVPHVGNLGGARVHDVAMAAAVVAAAGASAPLRLAPLPSPAEAVWYCRHAQLVVSTRYHPAVFATGAGTPALFLYQDRYTLVKGQGALALAGLQDWTVSAGLAALGLLVPAAVELWSRRDAVREHLRSLQPAIGRSRRRHVEALLAALLPATRPHVTVEAMIQRRGPLPEGEWVERAHDGGRAMLDSHALASELQRKQADLAIAHSALASELQRKEADHAIAHSALASELQRKEADHAIAHSALASELQRKETDLAIAHSALAGELQRKEADLLAAVSALAEMSSRVRSSEANWQVERELLERRAATAEQWAGVLAKEIERKEADLVIVQSALREIANREAGLPKETGAESGHRSPAHRQDQ